MSLSLSFVNLLIELIKGDYVVENEKSFLEDLINMHQRKMSCGGGDDAIHQLIDILFKHEKVFGICFI